MRMAVRIVDGAHQPRPRSLTSPQEVFCLTQHSSASEVTERKSWRREKQIRPVQPFQLILFRSDTAGGGQHRRVRHWALGREAQGCLHARRRKKGRERRRTPLVRAGPGCV